MRCEGIGKWYIAKGYSVFMSVTHVIFIPAHVKHYFSVGLKNEFEFIDA